MRRLSLSLSIAAMLAVLGGWLFFRRTATPQHDGQFSDGTGKNGNPGSKEKNGSDQDRGASDGTGAHEKNGAMVPPDSDGPTGHPEEIALNFEGKEPSYKIKAGESVKFNFPNSREYAAGATHADLELSVAFVAYDPRGKMVDTTNFSQVVAWSSKTIEVELPASITKKFEPGTYLKVVVVARTLGSEGSDSGAKANVQKGKCRLEIQAPAQNPK